MRGGGGAMCSVQVCSVQVSSVCSVRLVRWEWWVGLGGDLGGLRQLLDLPFVHHHGPFVAGRRPLRPLETHGSLSTALSPTLCHEQAAAAHAVRSAPRSLHSAGCRARTDAYAPREPG